MAINDSLSGDQVTIWFAPAGTVGADLSSDAKKVQSFITNFDESGGEKDTESVPVFGGGNVDRRKPRTQKELSFDVMLRHSTDITVFKDVEAENQISPDGAGTDFEVGEVILQATDGTNYYYQAYNNLDAIVFDTNFEAENEWQGTIRFKLSPTDPDGNKNIKFGAADVTSDLTSWP